MYHVRNDGNITTEIERFIYKSKKAFRVGILKAFTLLWYIRSCLIALYKRSFKCYINTKMNSSKMK